MEIPRITVTDATLLDTLVAAFADDPLYRWLYPDPSTRPAALRANLELTLTAARERGEVTTDERGTAVAMWTRPGVDLLDDPAPFVDLLERWAPGRRDAAFAGMAACADYADPADHVLHVLAVHPDRQNRGAAAQLLQPMLRRLDHEGRTAYLESSSERNLSFYRRNGFAVLGEVPVPAGGPIMRPMRREPAEGGEERGEDVAAPRYGPTMKTEP